MSRKRLIQNILDEEEDDDIMLYLYKRYQRGPVHSLFQKRTEEGYFKLLIEQYLKGDEEKFQKFCRLNKEQFNFVLTLNKKDIELQDV